MNTQKIIENIGKIVNTQEIMERNITILQLMRVDGT